MTGIGNCEDQRAQVAFVTSRQCDCVHSKYSGRQGPCPGSRRRQPDRQRAMCTVNPVQLVRAEPGLRMLPDSVLVGRDLATAVAGPSHFRIANGKCEEPGRTANRFAECTPAGKESPHPAFSRRRNAVSRDSRSPQSRAHRTRGPQIRCRKINAKLGITATVPANTAAAPPRRRPREPSRSPRAACAPPAVASAGRAAPPGRS